MDIFFIGCFQLIYCVHQRFGDKLSAVLSKSSFDMIKPPYCLYDFLYLLVLPSVGLDGTAYVEAAGLPCSALLYGGGRDAAGQKPRFFDVGD